MHFLKRINELICLDLEILQNSPPGRQRHQNNGEMSPNSPLRALQFGKDWVLAIWVIRASLGKDPWHLETPKLQRSFPWLSSTISSGLVKIGFPPSQLMKGTFLGVPNCPKKKKYLSTLSISHAKRWKPYTNVNRSLSITFDNLKFNFSPWNIIYQGQI